MWPTSSLFMPWICAPKYRDATWGKGSAYGGGGEGMLLASWYVDDLEWF